MKRLDSVFSVVPDCHASTGYYKTLWNDHFYEGLRGSVSRLVVPDIDFSWARQTPLLPPTELHKARSETGERLWSQIQAAHSAHGLDAVISYCYSNDLDLTVVANVRGMGIPWINFYCDSTHRFAEVVELAKIASLNWFPEHGAINQYKSLGTPYLCEPYAINHRRLAAVEYQTAREHAVGFVGMPTSNRITQLGLLRILGQKVAIRGKGWSGSSGGPFQSQLSARRKLFNMLSGANAYDILDKVARRLLWPIVRSQTGPMLNESEFKLFLEECEVILGLSEAKDSTGRFRSYLKFRDIEFPGYGCCYLTQRNSDVEHAFDVGHEVLVYDSVLEAAEILRKMRRHPSEAQRIGSAGRKRVLASHTWEARLTSLRKCL